MGISPKQNNDNLIYSQNNWYLYYAGYADGFIQNAIEEHGNSYDDPVIVDPWNGSGTTTVVAGMMNIKCYGFDINPAMLIIAKAKLFNPQKINMTTVRRNIQESNPCQLTKEEYTNDPLNAWFSKESVSAIRFIEEKIQYLSGFKKKSEKVIHFINACNFEKLSNEICFYYLALFTTLKQFTKKFVGSNPTWIKSKNIDKLNVNMDEISQLYLTIVEKMKTEYSHGINSEKIFLSIGNSKNIPLQSGIADMVITSPPYCTRIDYAVYTKIELSLLGYSSIDIRNLRSEMIGTPTISKGIDCSTDYLHNKFVNVSNICFDVMEKIFNHYSKAAKSYYFKTYMQYFIGMQQSMNEIYRILNRSGIAIIVVQDSWFKDIYVDVPGIIIEFAQTCGFSIKEKKDYEVRNNMNYINTKSRKYKNSKKTVESVIVFKKG